MTGRHALHAAPLAQASAPRRAVATHHATTRMPLLAGGVAGLAIVGLAIAPLSLARPAHVSVPAIAVEATADSTDVLSLYSRTSDVSARVALNPATSPVVATSAPAAPAKPAAPAAAPAAPAAAAPPAAAPAAPAPAAPSSTAARRAIPATTTSTPPKPVTSATSTPSKTSALAPSPSKTTTSTPKPTQTATPTASASKSTVSGVAAKAVAYAKAQLGAPYEVGTMGPDTFDCAGLVAAAYQSAGYPMVFSEAWEVSHGTAVSRSNLQPGDVIHWVSSGHESVSIYIGNDTIVIADGPTYGVRTDTLTHRETWDVFGGARRYA